MISSGDLKTKFSESLTLLSGPRNTGLNFVVIAALILHKARALGATWVQMKTLVLGERFDRAHEIKLGLAKNLALRWQQGLPDEISSANSPDAQFNAAIYWLARQGVAKQDDLGPWLVTGSVPREETQVTRAARTVFGSMRNFESGGWNGYSAEEFAQELIALMSPEYAKIFCDAATEAFTLRFGKI